MGKEGEGLYPGPPITGGSGPRHPREGGAGGREGERRGGTTPA
jgi:hypothetical protein